MNSWSLRLSLGYRYLFVVTSLSIATWLAYLYLDRPSLGIDDAHIFFVYARNLSSGQGIVYNPGGERVEGYSSPLWMLIAALAFALLDNPLPALLLITLLLLGIGITLLWRWLDASDVLTLKGVLFLLWVFSSPSFIIWTTLTLMDTALWSVLLTLGCVILLSRPKSLYMAVLVALIVLMRPEGMLWGLVFSALWGLAHLDTGWQSALRQIMKPLISYIVTLVLLIGSRLVYFGYPLPNTYYAKMSPDIGYNLFEGTVYLGQFLATNPHVLFITLALSISIIFVNVLWLLRLFRNPVETFEEKRIQSINVAWLALVGLFVPVWTGGDHFSLFRFYQPVWPLFVLPIISLADLIKVRLTLGLRYAGIACLILIFCLGQWTNWFWGDTLGTMRFEFTLPQTGRNVGQALNEMFVGDKPSVGVITAGAIAYTYGGTVIDVLGLNNVDMAHTPGDRYGMKNHSGFNSDIFLLQRPNLFLPELASKDANPELLCESFAEWILTDLFDRQLFWQTYQRTILSRYNNRIVAYADKEFLGQLPPQDFEVESLDCLPK